MSKQESIALDDIRTDGGTQSRAEIRDAVVETYVSKLQADEQFPPIEVYYDGTDYWLSDGFHRHEAYRREHYGHVDCIVHQGTQADAQWASYAANKGQDQNGLPRTNADKQRAVRAAIQHPSGAKMSDRALADHIGVYHTMVSKYRRAGETTVHGVQSTERIGRDGRTYNTSAIGKSRREVSATTEVVNTATGEVVDDAEIVTTKTTETKQVVAADPDVPAARGGRGIELAHEAIAVLKRIHINDPLRSEGLDIAFRWIRDNR